MQYFKWCDETNFKGKKITRKKNSSLLICCKVFSAAIQTANCWAEFKRRFRTDWRTKRIHKCEAAFYKRNAVSLSHSLSHLLTLCRLPAHTHTRCGCKTGKTSFQCTRVCLYVLYEKKMWFVWRKLGLGNWVKEIKSKIFQVKRAVSTLLVLRQLRARYDTIRNAKRNLNMNNEFMKNKIKMQFKRKFSMHPNNQRAAIWLQHGNSMFVFDSISFSHSRMLSLCVCIQPVQVHIQLHWWLSKYAHAFAKSRCTIMHTVCLSTSQ